MNIYDQLKQLSKRVDDADKKLAEAVELPVVSGADNGNVLTVVSGAWAKAAIPSQLPSVTTSDEGSILTVNSSGEWAKGNPIGGGLDYSTTEQNTGIKWIDGKEIYQRTFEQSVGQTLSADIDISTLDVDNIIDMEIFGNGVSQAWYGDFYDSGSTRSRVYYNKASSLISIRVGGSNEGTFYITIRYTKNITKATKKKTTK